MRHEVFNLLQAHSLLDCPLHPDKADAVLIFKQLANCTDATISEMIDIIDGAAAILKLYKITNNFKYVIFDGDLDIRTKQIFNQSAIFIKTTLLNRFGQFNCCLGKSECCKQFLLEKIIVTNYVVKLKQQLISELIRYRLARLDFFESFSKIRWKFHHQILRERVIRTSQSGYKRFKTGNIFNAYHAWCV